MPEADLYLDKIDLCRYWPDRSGMSCEQFKDSLLKHNKREDFTFLTPGQKKALDLVITAASYLPSVPLFTVPQPVEKGLVMLNEPDENSLVLVTANNRLTVEVVAAIWSRGTTPAYFLLVDCLGNTVDMAVVYHEFKPERLASAIAETGLESKVTHRHMIVPGFTYPLVEEFARATSWEVEVGPVCGVELPLFLGDRWRF